MLTTSHLISSPLNLTQFHTMQCTAVHNVYHELYLYPFLTYTVQYNITKGTLLFPDK